MNTRSAVTATLAAIFSVSAAFVDPAASLPAKARTPSVAASDASIGKGPDTVQAAKMKSILLKLMRQDEYLDEAIGTIESANGKLSAHNISALGLSFKIIKTDLDNISAMNKKEIPEIQPEPGIAACTKTILSYSRSVSRKIARIDSLMAKTAAVNRKQAMRDAVSSRKGKKTRNGKKLTQVLEEQKAMETLSSDIQALKTSSRKVAATSKWLYVVSK
ncbi:MAG: hypothetical protein WCS77_10705 [Elusimicrobiaceae bacterium]